jgi:hypothetical protein
MRTKYRSENLSERNHSEDLDVDERILKLNLKKHDVGCGLNSYESEPCPVAVPC